MSENSGYRMHSRGYKTKGYEYKDRYVDDKICPECDGTSVYRDEWSTIVSYKCLRRSCRHQWFENVNEPQEDPKDMVSKYEQIKIDEELKERQEHQQFVHDYLMNFKSSNLDRVDDTDYSIVGYRQDSTTQVLGKHLKFEEISKIIEKEKEEYVNFEVFEERAIGHIPSNLYIVANAEGYIEETKELFYRPIHLNETFILAGNFIGKINFLSYLEYLFSLKDKRPCIFIKGENEHNLLEYIHGTENYLGNLKNNKDMIEAIELELGFNLKELPDRYPKLYSIIKEAKDYFENDTHIVVSGGIDLSIPFWKQSDKEHLYLTSKEFLNNKNYTGKKVVFGNMDINTLSGETNYGIWRNNKNTKIGINGNVSSGNKLIALSILDNETNFLSVKNKEAKAKRLKERYNDLDLDNLF